ncbi:MAG TPA: aa3-type cytochrome c oxidase subunit IV [Caulobacteraceae bacterium]|jgi:hypothetical protein|nr:aa3-type cytochrome c oxidase subunit IV [Caulobacteraceae bacterium]
MAQHPPPTTGAAELHQHEITFHHFMLVVRWAVVLHIAGLPFLVMWFCTGAGFLAAAVTGAVIFAIATWALIAHDQPLGPPGSLAQH